MLPERQPVEVVALVASAGGLDAFTAVLRALGPELPVPILLQQHLGGQGSVLPTILGRRTGRAVVWAQEFLADPDSGFITGQLYSVNGGQAVNTCDASCARPIDRKGA